LREYVEEHKDDMEVETAQRHARAQKGLADRVTSWPLPKAEWLRWLEREQATYDKALKLDKVGGRRLVNVRAPPHPDVPRKDPAIRVKPHIDTGRPAWARQLCNRWHALRLKDTGARVVIFVVCCAGKLVPTPPKASSTKGLPWFPPQHG
jgi:hypothetical protein